VSARLAELDGGGRCEAHVGEVFPPRCAACDLDVANAGDSIDHAEDVRLSALFSRSGYIPGSECSAHPNYPMPCDRCARDRAADRGERS
jgi:hypothetical protein